MKAINPTQIKYEGWSIPERVHHGGGWRNNKMVTLPSGRDSNDPHGRVHMARFLGFRLVRNK